jgi:hypothetical protein
MSIYPSLYSDRPDGKIAISNLVTEIIMFLTRQVAHGYMTGIEQTMAPDLKLSHYHNHSQIKKKHDGQIKTSSSGTIMLARVLRVLAKTPLSLAQTG